MTYFFNCSQNKTRTKWHGYKWLDLNLPRASSATHTPWGFGCRASSRIHQVKNQCLSNSDQSFWKDEIGTARLPQTLISLPIHDKEFISKKYFVSNFSTEVLNFCISWRLHKLSTLKILDILMFLGFSSFFSMYLSALLTEEIPAYLVLKSEIAKDSELW